MTHSRRIGPKNTDPQYEGCAFHISHVARCAVSDSRPCTLLSITVFTVVIWN